MSTLESISKAVAFLVLLKTTYSLSSFLSVYIRPSSLPRYLIHSESPKDAQKAWALVTGGSDGIGFGFVENLLASGFNVLIHGRNATKLAGIEAKLKPKYPHLQIATIAADAMDPEAAIRAIAAMVSEIEAAGGKLKVLINNVGGTAMVSPTNFNDFSTYTPTALDGMINVNARFPLQLTHALLHRLSANSPSLILNMGSSVGIHGIPFIVPYAACKAFNHVMSQSLSTELKAMGTDIECLGIVVGSVQSAGNKINERLMQPSSFTMAKAALGRVGCGQRLLPGYFWHAVQFAIIASFPDWVIEKLLIFVIHQRRDAEIVQKGLKKE